jgi:hypothetical protein
MFIKTRITFASLVFLAGAAMASASAAPLDDAKALANKATDLIAAEGDQAFPKISDAKGEFVQGNLYVSSSIIKVSFAPTGS